MSKRINYSHYSSFSYLRNGTYLMHYNDVIMGTIPSQITSLTAVYSTVYADADQRKHQNSASLAFVRGIHRGPVNSPHKWPVTRKRFHLMTSSWKYDVYENIAFQIKHSCSSWIYLNKWHLWHYSALSAISKLHLSKATIELALREFKDKSRKKLKSWHPIQNSWWSAIYDIELLREMHESHAMALFLSRLIAW